MINESTTKAMRLKALGALLGMFLIGVLVGGMGLNLYQRSSAPNPENHERGTRGPRGPRGDRRPGRMLEHLRTDLQLTAEQTEQIKQILAKSREEMNQLREETRPRYTALRDRLQTDIKAVLTPEQAQKFEEISRRREADHRRPEHERGGPPKP